MERGFDIAPDEFYHIYSRGVDRRAIVLDDEDREYFQKLLFLCNSTERIILRDLPRGLSVYTINRPVTLVDIGAYCLMPNHFHLLIYEKEDGGAATFMAKLLTAYAKYFNKKSQRTGALFDGRYRARHADENAYLHYLHAYIHLNPVKLIQPLWKERGIKNQKEVASFLHRYTFSSYHDYIGIERVEKCILQRGSFPEYFSNEVEFETFIGEWLSYKDTEP